MERKDLFELKDGQKIVVGCDGASSRTITVDHNSIFAHVDEKDETIYLGDIYAGGYVYSANGIRTWMEENHLRYEIILSVEKLTP